MIASIGDALGLGQIADVLVGRRVEVDDAVRVARADSDLVHVDVGGVQQRALVGHGERGDRAGHVLGAERGAFERIDRDVDLRAALAAHLLADEQHRRFVHLALADHNRAVDQQLAEFAPHRVDRGLIGFFLGAAPAQTRRRDRCPLGHPGEFDRENALNHRRLRLSARRHRFFS